MNKILFIVTLCISIFSVSHETKALCSNYNNYVDGQVLTASSLNALQSNYTNCVNNVLDGDIFTGSINLYGSADLNLYSDSGSTLKASIDGATGNIEAENEIYTPRITMGGYVPFDNGVSSSYIKYDIGGVSQDELEFYTDSTLRFYLSANEILFPTHPTTASTANAYIDPATGSLKRSTSTLATLTGSETLTNKTITSPTITGTVAGGATYSSPTLTTPTIASFTNATHDHSNAAGGGNIPETSITDGAVLARVGANETITGAYTFPSAGTPTANATYRQGIGKAYAKFTTGVYSIPVTITADASFNITQINRTGANAVTITWNTDFSSSDYVVLISDDHSSTHGRLASQAAGTTSFGSIQDNTTYHVIAFGDQ